MLAPVLQAVSALNWNHLYPKWPNATGKELIVHLTNMPRPEPCEPGMHCKFKGVMLYWDAVSQPWLCALAVQRPCCAYFTPMLLLEQCQ